MTLAFLSESASACKSFSVAQTQRNGGKQWTAATAAKSEVWSFVWSFICELVEDEDGFYWWSYRFCPELLPNYRHVCLLFLLCGMDPLRNSVRLSAAGIYVDPLQKLDFFDFCTSKNRWTEFAALAAALAPCNTAKIRRDWCNSGRFQPLSMLMKFGICRANWSDSIDLRSPLERWYCSETRRIGFSNLVEQLFQLPFSHMCLLHCRIQMGVLQNVLEIAACSLFPRKPSILYKGSTHTPTGVTWNLPKKTHDMWWVFSVYRVPYIYIYQLGCRTNGPGILRLVGVIAWTAMSQKFRILKARGSN